MADGILTQVEKFRDSRPGQVFIACTGGGAGLQQALWNLPGCSSFLTGAVFPYAARATNEFLGFAPKSYCSRETAIQLAMQSYYRAYAPGAERSIGLGLCAVVATKEKHRGEHRIFAAVMVDTDCLVHEVVLERRSGDRARIDDGEICDLVGLNALRSAVGLSIDPIAKYPNVKRAEISSGYCEGCDLFLQHPVFRPDGTRTSVRAMDAEIGMWPSVMMPGAFNPAHGGHYQMARVVEHYQGRPVVFQISLSPPHKTGLGLGESLRRAKGLVGKHVLFLTNDALYIDKARQFPGTAFIIGIDAVIRMLDPKWGPKIEPMLAELRRLGTRFYVFGRMVGEQGFQTLADIDIPEAGRELFKQIEGRWDVSSSALRAEQRAEAKLS